MNRLITAAVAIFGDEQHTINILQRTRFFSQSHQTEKIADGRTAQGP